MPKVISVAKGFTYSDALQRSPEWLAIRATRLGASEIGKYMAKGVKGQYLAGRKEVEKKIAYAKAFGVPFEGFVSGAMLAGIEQESFILEQYCESEGVQVESVGCAFNEWFVASPDDKIVGQNGGVEAKWLYDNEFSELLLTGFPKDLHYDQMQGQMWAFDWDFVDYVAGNGNTNSFYVLRVNRNQARIDEIMLEGESVLAIEPMEMKGVHKFSKDAPELPKSELPF